MLLLMSCQFCCNIVITIEALYRCFLVNAMEYQCYDPACSNLPYILSNDNMLMYCQNHHRKIVQYSLFILDLKGTGN